jgi:hypothetical protein
VIDFDAVLRDPDHPSKLLPRFASPDHLHPNDVGYPPASRPPCHPECTP